jgi:N,N'-diacetyllegionaminate synthase
MKRYVIVLKIPQIIQDGCNSIVNEIAQKFNVANIKNYPVHIPLKYGFNFEDEEKLITIIKKFNNQMKRTKVTINSPRNNEKTFHLSILNDSLLKELQTNLQQFLKEKLPIDDFREVELDENYQFHLSLAQSCLDEQTSKKVKDYLETKNLNFSFSTTSLAILVKEGNGFKYLSMEDKKMTFYEKLIDPKNPFIIGEIGSNHNGDLNIAKQLIDMAKDAGCNAVKFQSFEYNSLFAQSILDNHKDLVAKDVDAVGLEAIQKKLALTNQNHIELKRYCDEKNITFLSTPLGMQHVDFLDQLNVSAYKIASLDIVNLPLLKKVAAKGKPVLLSTGMATMGEIDNAIRTLKKAGCDKIVLLHCLAVYPTPSEQVNLQNIKMLKNTFNLPVGFSDHSTSTAIPAAAITYGASVIEKHIKIEGLGCRDEPVSLGSAELKRLVKDIHDVAKAIGTTKRILTDDEKKRRVSVFGRRSILLARSMKTGEMITQSDLIFKRPGTGLSPDKLKYLLGRTLKVDKNFEDTILIEDLS